MSIGSWIWGTSQLDDAVEKATSELLPAGSEDIALNLEICDQIRSKAAPPKDAMRAIKNRLNHKNPNVQLLALGLTDTCVKNGGDHFLTEIASREFMDNLTSILKMPALNLDVKNAMLRLIQNWSVAFEGKPALSYVGQVYKTLQHEGFKFPPKDLTTANSAMVDTQTAPEWIDSDVCLRCRTPFTFTNRKHHCRNCGQVFDQQCSSKSLPLPHFGITQEVRVCDGCFAKLTRHKDKPSKSHRHSTSMHGSRSKSARDLADAELQRAIQLSLQEVNSATGANRHGYVPSQPSPSAWQYSEPPLVDRNPRPKSSNAVSEEEEDPDLKAAIEASLREANAPKPSAPIAVETPRAEEPSYSGPGHSQSYPPGVVPPHPTIKLPNYDLEPLESDAIMTFSQTVDQVHASGSRDMSRYPAVNELYDKANSLRPKLAMSLDDAGRKEQMLTEMHDKMSQIVKLYDNILSQQISQPRWRSSIATSPPPQQVQPQHTGYTQWSSQAQPPALTTQPQQSYFSPEAQAQSIPTSPPLQPQQQYYQQQQPERVQPPAQYYQQAPQQEQYGQMTQQNTGQTTPISAAPQTPRQQHYHTSWSEPRQQQQQVYAEPPPSAPPQPLQQQTIPLAPPMSPQQQYVSPPGLTQYSQAPPATNGLQRNATVSYSSAPTTNGSALARSNTVAHSVPRQQAYQQPQQVASAPPPSSTGQHLPQFPVAPTSAPQTYDMYAPSGVPNGVPQERKEALLIDL